MEGAGLWLGGGHLKLNKSTLKFQLVHLETIQPKIGYLKLCIFVSVKVMKVKCGQRE